MKLVLNILRMTLSITVREAAMRVKWVTMTN